MTPDLEVLAKNSFSLRLNPQDIAVAWENKDQTGATLFKTTPKVELFSGFDGRPISRASKKIVAFKMKKIFRNCDMARKSRVVYLYTKKVNRAS